MLTWHRDIESASTTVQVVRLAREYVGGLAPHDLARLPKRCLPPRILDEADISRHSARLTQEYWRLRGTPADVGVLQEMWSFFMRASIQVARINELAHARRSLDVLRPPA